MGAPINATAESFEDALGDLKRRVQPPPGWSSPPQRTPLPPTEGDPHRFVRYAFRTDAILEQGDVTRPVPREASRSAVITIDISREGMSFFHSEQLFPLESFKMLLPGADPRSIVVMRCLRRGDQCYEIGARFE